jgi:hypothetical protein
VAGTACHAAWVSQPIATNAYVTLCLWGPATHSHSGAKDQDRHYHCLRYAVQIKSFQGFAVLFHVMVFQPSRLGPYIICFVLGCQVRLLSGRAAGVGLTSRGWRFVY